MHGVGSRHYPTLKSRNIRHAGITGLWTQELDAGLLMLDSRLRTLDTVVDCYRTESEPSFYFA